MQQTKRFRKALRGLDGMTVWVHDVAPDASSDGLSRQHLQDSVVIRLLDSGLKALGIGNVPEPLGNPWLNVFVNTRKHGNHYFYGVTVRLDEIVRPDRNSSVKLIGTTWEISDWGVSSLDAFAQDIERVLDSLVDYFVYDYLGENHP